MTDRRPPYDQNETPDDVATLYSWANLHGAKYRDFSASRAQTREQVRLRVQQALEAEQSAATQSQPATSQPQTFDPHPFQSEPGESQPFQSQPFPPQPFQAEQSHAAQSGFQPSLADLSHIDHRTEADRAAEVQRLAETARAAEEARQAELIAQYAARKAAEQAAHQAAQREQARLAAEQAAQQEWARLAAEHAAQQEQARLAAENAARQEQARLAAEQAAKQAAAQAAELAASQESERAVHEAALQAEAAREALAAQWAAQRTQAAPPAAWQPAQAAPFPAFLAPHPEATPAPASQYDYPAYAHAPQQRPAASQPPQPPLREESYETRETARTQPWAQSWPEPEAQEPVERPAWLTPDRPDFPAQPAVPHAPEDTLQGSRDRLTSRWYALRGVFETQGTPQEAPAPAPARAPVLALFSLAGGVGKTSLAATMGRALSSRGERVLLVDTAAYGLLPFFFGAHDQRPGQLRTFSPPGTSTDAPIQMVTIDPDGLGAESSNQEALCAEIGKYSRGVSRVIVDLATASGATTRRVLKMAPLVLVPMVPDMNSVVSVSSIDSFSSTIQTPP
jgi:hypothetical protein